MSYKKIETNQLMGSIQLGIQASIGGLAKYPDRDLLMQDFMKVETTQFSKHGSKQTPAHSYADFTFRTYAPVAFRYFRELFGIQPEDFMMSICNEPMRELSNPGASGSIFYLTRDDEFILKTVSMKEAEFLQKLLPGYYMNLQQNPRTTLPKFFGMFCYQCNQKNIRLVVMNNLLPSIVKMHLKFDLKGSTYKRKVESSDLKISIILLLIRHQNTSGKRILPPSKILTSLSCFLRGCCWSLTRTQQSSRPCREIVECWSHLRSWTTLSWLVFTILILQLEREKRRLRLRELNKLLQRRTALLHILLPWSQSRPPVILLIFQENFHLAAFLHEITKERDFFSLLAS